MAVTEPTAPDPWEPGHKEEWLIAQGKMWPDGTIVQHCPTCGRTIEQGEVIPALQPPEGEGDAVAQAEPVATDAATGEV